MLQISLLIHFLYRSVGDLEFQGYLYTISKYAEFSLTAAYQLCIIAVNCPFFVDLWY